MWQWQPMTVTDVCECVVCGVCVCDWTLSAVGVFPPMISALLDKLDVSAFSIWKCAAAMTMAGWADKNAGLRNQLRISTGRVVVICVMQFPSTPDCWLEERLRAVSLKAMEEAWRSCYFSICKHSHVSAQLFNINSTRGTLHCTNERHQNKQH